MITEPEPPRRRRTLRVALLLSLLVHASGAALYGSNLPFLKTLRARHPLAAPTPFQRVAISDSFRVDKKAVVAPPQHAAPAHRPRHRVAPAPPPQQAIVPQPQRVARVPVPPVPVPVRKAVPTPRPVVRRERHELAKTVPHASAAPPKTLAVRATPPPERVVRTPAPATPQPLARAVPTLPPERPRRRIVPPKVVALSEPAPAHPSRVARNRLSPEQIAAIDSDLAKTIAQVRHEENPLRVPKTAAAAPRRYAMSVDSVHVGSLKSGEGTYWPVDQGRRGPDGYTYYRCAYAFQWPDGTYEQGVVPWPVRFAPSEDPMLHPDLEANGPIGLPGPAPGFQLAANARVGRALRSFFPNVVFTGE